MSTGFTSSLIPTLDSTFNLGRLTPTVLRWNMIQAVLINATIYPRDIYTPGPICLDTSGKLIACSPSSPLTTFNGTSVIASGPIQGGSISTQGAMGAASCSCGSTQAGALQADSVTTNAITSTGVCSCASLSSPTISALNSSLVSLAMGLTSLNASLSSYATVASLASYATTTALAAVNTSLTSSIASLASTVAALPSPLYYAEQNVTLAMTGPWSSTLPMFVQLVRVGRQVTAMLAGVQSGSLLGSGAIAGGPLPLGFRPSSAIRVSVNILNSAASFGVLIVGADGTVTVYSSAVLGLFGILGTVGLYGCSVSYNV